MTNSEKLYNFFSKKEEKKIIFEEDITEFGMRLRFVTEGAILEVAGAVKWEFRRDPPNPENPLLLYSHPDSIIRVYAYMPATETGRCMNPHKKLIEVFTLLLDGVTDLKRMGGTLTMKTSLGPLRIISL